MQEVAQPYGGYINSKDMIVKSFEGEQNLNDFENVHAALIGLAVDYLTRYMLTKDAFKAFKISIIGAETMNMVDKANYCLKQINGLDDLSIKYAIKLVGFDVACRAGIKAYKPIEEIEPSIDTIENVRIMVNRSLEFFKVYGPVTKFGYTFEGGYTSVIFAGDGDFMTKDTLWDFKVSKYNPEKLNTFQLLIYYIMGLHSKYPEYKEIKYLGIFNPRLNKMYTYDVSLVKKEYIKRIEEEVIGY